MAGSSNNPISSLMKNQLFDGGVNPPIGCSGVCMEALKLLASQRTNIREVTDMRRTAVYLLVACLIGGLMVTATRALLFGHSWSDAALDGVVLSSIVFCGSLLVRYRRNR
jgi:hypothetical protein